MPHYSLGITIRRIDGTSYGNITLVENYIRLGGGQFALTVEMADTPGQHCHIYWDTKRRPNNVCVALKKLLKIERGTPEWFHACKVKKCDDPLIWLGYLLKEVKDLTTVRTNMTEESLEEARGYHEIEEVSAKPKSMNTKNFIELMTDFMNRNNIVHLNPKYASVIKLMFLSKQYYMNDFLLKHNRMRPMNLFNLEVNGRWDDTELRSCNYGQDQTAAELNRSNENLDKLHAMFEKESKRD